MGGTPPNGDLGTLVDVIAMTNYAIENNYLFYSSWNLAGSTLRVNFPDSATKTYTGVMLSNPNADRGSATVSGYEFHNAGGTITISGRLHYEYAVTPSASGPSLAFGGSAMDSSINMLRMASHLPPTSSGYDQLMGNASMTVNGALSLRMTTGDMNGTISKITVAADKYLQSASIEGNFFVKSNLLTAGQGLTHSLVEGVLSAYKENYYDGSYFHVTDLSAYVHAAQILDTRVLAQADYYGGNDDISIDMPGRLYRDVLMAAGDGDDQISIKGGGGRLHVAAGSGNDQITILGDAHSVDGGSGIDTVRMLSSRADFVFQRSSTTSTSYSMKDKAGTVNQLVDVERIVFSDATLALDIDGNAGKAYRLYEAAFDRTPDAVGLGFWISVLDKGGSLNSVAQGFVDSPEFRAAYGAGLSNRDLVTKFYNNILDRTPDQGGLDFWVGLLDTQKADVADVLEQISESAENKAGLIGVIGNGFTYTPYEHA